MESNSNEVNIGSPSRQTSKRLMRTARRGAGRAASGSFHDYSEPSEQNLTDGEVRFIGAQLNISLIPSFIVPDATAVHTAEAKQGLREMPLPSDQEPADEARAAVAHTSSAAAASANERAADCQPFGAAEEVSGGTQGRSQPEQSLAAGAPTSAIQEGRVSLPGQDAAAAAPAEPDAEPAVSPAAPNAAEAASIDEELGNARQQGDLHFEPDELAQAAAGGCAEEVGVDVEMGEQQQQDEEQPPADAEEQEEWGEEMEEEGGEEEEEEEVAATPVLVDVAACSRSNLRLLIASRAETSKLIEVEQLLDGYCKTNGVPLPPSLLHGLVVRCQKANAYFLSRLLGAERGPDGRLMLLLKDGITSQIPLIGVARGNALVDDAAWDAQGQEEAAALHAAIRAAGRLWGPFEVALSAWRKKLVLAWHAFVTAIEGDRQAELPILLSKLSDPGSIAKLLARVETEQTTASAEHVQAQHEVEEGGLGDAEVAAPAAEAAGAAAGAVQPAPDTSAPLAAQRARQQAAAPAQEGGAGGAHQVPAPSGTQIGEVGAQAQADSWPSGEGRRQQGQPGPPSWGIPPGFQPRQEPLHWGSGTAQDVVIGSYAATPSAPNFLGAAAPHQPPSALSASMFIGAGAGIGAAPAAPTPEALRAMLSALPANLHPQAQAPQAIPAALRQLLAAPASQLRGAAQPEEGTAWPTPFPPSVPLPSVQQQQPAGALAAQQPVMVLARQGTPSPSMQSGPGQGSAQPSGAAAALALLPPSAEELGARQPAHAGTGAARAAAGVALHLAPSDVEAMAAHVAGAAAKLESSVGAAHQQQEQQQGQREQQQGQREQQQGQREQQQGQREQQRQEQQAAQQQVWPAGALPRPQPCASPAHGKQERRQVIFEDAHHHPQQTQKHQQQHEDAAESARQRRRQRQPILWQPQESEPGDRPLVISKPAALAGGKDGAGGAVAAPAAAVAAGRQPSMEALPSHPVKLQITCFAEQQHPSLGTQAVVKPEQSPGKSGPVVRVNAAGLQAPSPAAPSGSALAPGAGGRARGGQRAAVHEADGKLTCVVRVPGDSGGDLVRQASQSQQGSQQAQLLAQLQQLGHLAPSLDSAGVVGTGGAGPLIPPDLLQMPAHILLSLYGAQVLQQQLGDRQSQVEQALVASEAQAPGQRAGEGGGGAGVRLLKPPQQPQRMVLDEEGAEEEEEEDRYGEARRSGKGHEGHASRGAEEQVPREQQGKGLERFIRTDSAGNPVAVVSVQLRGTDDFEEGRHYLESLTRRVVPSRARRSAIQRACLRELLRNGLSSDGDGMFMQAGINVAHLGMLLIKASKASPQVAAEYEEYGNNSRLGHLVADLEHLGLVVRVETKRGRVEVLLRVDRLERLAGAEGAGASGGKRSRAPSEATQPPSKHARREDHDHQHHPSSSTRRQPGPFPRVSRAPSADHRGTTEYADFWDPVWRFEHSLVRFLRKRGQVELVELYQCLPMPEIYGEPTWEAFRSWLLQRPHLFDLSGELVGAVKGASALLQYKRDMLQYLGEQRPAPRANLEEGLQRDVALPSDMPQTIVQEALANFWLFLTKYYGKEVWLVPPKHYTPSRFLKTVELRPFHDPAPHPLAPRMHGVCRYFDASRPGSCTKQELCNFSHCTERVIY